MEYKYFDTIDEKYIQFISQKFPSSSKESEEIINAKIEKYKYKDIDLGSLYKIHSEPAVLYDIYLKIVSRLGFKDLILLYKWHVENYDHGIGIKTPYQVKQFYKELSVVRDLYSRTLLLLGFSIRYLFIFNLLSLQLLIFLFRLNNQSQNYIYILLANLQILL